MRRHLQLFISFRNSWVLLRCLKADSAWEKYREVVKCTTEKLQLKGIAKHSKELMFCSWEVSTFSGFILSLYRECLPLYFCIISQIINSRDMFVQDNFCWKRRHLWNHEVLNQPARQNIQFMLQKKGREKKTNKGRSNEPIRVGHGRMCWIIKGLW